MTQVTVEQAAEMQAQTAAALIAAVDGRLFPFGDIPAAARLAARVRAGQGLTADEARAAWRLLNRNAAALESVGIHVPRREAAPDTVAIAPPQRVGSTRPELAIRSNTRSQKAPYNQHIVVTHSPYVANDALKSVAYAQWDKVNRWWHTPATPAHAAALMAALGAFDPLPSPRVAALVQEFATLVERRRVLHPEHPDPTFSTAHLVNGSLWPHQMRAVQFSAGSTASMLGMRMGPQPVDTPVLTPKGWRELGHLAVGDEVFGADGSPVRIRAARHYGVQPVWRVTLSDGTSTVCTAQHRWRVSSAHQRQSGNSRAEVWSTEEMLRYGLHGAASRNAARFFLPDQPVLALPGGDDDLPIPAYSLGVLLGDGYLAQSISVTCPDDEVTGRLRRECAAAFGTTWRDERRDGRCVTWNARRSALNDRLAAEGLRVTSARKHVPDRYLIANEATRRDLLAGLLDTDGSGRGNCRVEFSSASPDLTSAVAWLARSLGAVVREAGPSNAGYRDQDGKYVRCLDRYRAMLFFPADAPSPFYLSRKRIAYEALAGVRMQRRRPPRSVRAIEPAGERPVCCIELDVPDGDRAVYLTDTALIPTLNSGKTAAAIAAANYVQAARVVIVCPNKVRGVWPREIAKWSAQPWHIVDGTRPAKRRGARRQDLRMSERFEQAEQCLFDCTCGAPHHGVVMNYEMLVHAPFSTWHPPMPLDLAIYDEIHRVKSPKNTGMSANLATWVDFTTRRIGLSGTPMPQYPWDIFGVYRALDPGIFGPFWTPFKGEYIHMRTREADGQQFPAAILTEAREQFATKVHSIMYRPQVDLKLPAVTHYIRQVDLEPEAREQYDRLADDLWADLTTFDRVSTEDGVDVGDDAVLTPKNVLSRLLRLMQITGGTVPDDEGVKRRVSTAKADALMEFDGGGPIGGILYEAGCYPGHPGGVEPVCVYAQFRDDLDAIRAVAERAGLRYREISGRRSDGLTDTSELAPNADVVGVQIQAGGTGVDLTRSSVGIWYSKGHSLGDYDQALARQHRPGQARPVTFVHIEAAGTVDHDVYRSLMGRRSVVAGVLAIRGLNRASLGGDDNPAAPDEVDTVTSDDLMSDGGIRLPIDEFGVDVMGDPRPPVKAMPDTATVEALWLDDVL